MGQFNVLLIEDDKLAQIILRFLINTIAPNPSLCDTVKQSIEILKKQKFDLVISDIGLPDGTGIEIIQRIKSDPLRLNYDTPFIALTAHIDMDKQKEILENGFLESIPKPLTKEKVQEIYKKYLCGKD
jgi:CheY-like chemotaxis protein